MVVAVGQLVLEPLPSHVAPGGLFYEPFPGSGSQIMAGETNGRRVFAMEMSPAYIDVAVEHWQSDTGRNAILDGDGRTVAQVRTERLDNKAEATLRIKISQEARVWPLKAIGGRESERRTVGVYS